MCCDQDCDSYWEEAVPGNEKMVRKLWACDEIIYFFEPEPHINPFYEGEFITCDGLCSVYHSLGAQIVISGHETTHWHALYCLPIEVQ